MSPPLSFYNKRTTPPLSSKTIDSFNSSGSCCPKGYPNLQMYKKANRISAQCSVSKSSEVRQRVASARMNRLRTVQNQLSDAHGHIGELLNENRLLRTIHKRQDNALAKYEGSNAELPQLLNSHADETRAWQIRCRNLQSQNRELSNKLKQKDAILLTLTDHNRHLSQLNVDKNLEERDKLSEKVRLLETQLAEKDEELKVLHRRIQLEAKGYKQQINSGIAKQRELTIKLEKANSEIIRIGEAIRTESMIIPNKMTLGSYLRNTGSMTGKTISVPKKADVTDRVANGGGDSTKKETTSANVIKSTKKSPPSNTPSSKTLTRNLSQQSSEAFPLMKSYMANKANRSKPLTLANNIKNSMMDFTDIKYPNTKSHLQNSSSMESSDTIHYDDDEFELSTATHGTVDSNNLSHHGTVDSNNLSDNIESDELTPDVSLIDRHLIGDQSFEKYSSYSDQRNVNGSGDSLGFKLSEDDNRNEIEKTQKDLHSNLTASESFLDSLCETVSKDLNISREKPKLVVRPGVKGKDITAKKAQKPRVNSGLNKKKPLDPAKKSELLAALKTANEIDV